MQQPHSLGRVLMVSRWLDLGEVIRIVEEDRWKIAVLIHVQLVELVELVSYLEP